MKYAAWKFPLKNSVTMVHITNMLLQVSYAFNVTSKHCINVTSTNIIFDNFSFGIQYSFIVLATVPQITIF